MSRILLIEDAPDVRSLVSQILSDFEVVTVETLAEGEKELLKGGIDLVLLDVTLPDGDGFRFCATLRTMPKGDEIPVIFLTGRGDVNDRVAGFSLGAEDYITKPFEVKEFRARMLARLNKIKSKKVQNDLYTKGNLRINLATQRAFRIHNGRDEPLDLTPIEFKLLNYFAKNEENVLTREKLIDVLWGGAVHVLDRTIDAHISKLRKKLQGCSYTIKSVYGSGYAFRSLVSEYNTDHLAATNSRT